MEDQKIHQTVNCKVDKNYAKIIPKNTPKSKPNFSQ